MRQPFRMISLSSSVSSPSVTSNSFSVVAVNCITFDHICFLFYCLADSREEQIIAVLERKLTGTGSGMEAYPS